MLSTRHRASRTGAHRVICSTPHRHHQQHHHQHALPTKTQRRPSPPPSRRPHFPTHRLSLAWRPVTTTPKLLSTTRTQHTAARRPKRHSQAQPTPRHPTHVVNRRAAPGCAHASLTGPCCNHAQHQQSELPWAWACEAGVAFRRRRRRRIWDSSGQGER